MKKRVFTKWHDLVHRADEVLVTATDTEFFIAVNAHIIVRVPDWRYREWQDAGLDMYPVLMPCESFNVTKWKDCETDVKNLWEQLFAWKTRAYNEDYLAAEVAENRSYNGHKCTMIDAANDRVMLNKQYVDAIKQATGFAAVYAATRRRPVWFYDDTEIYRSTFSACIMPVNYTGELAPVA